MILLIDKEQETTFYEDVQYAKRMRMLDLLTFVKVFSFYTYIFSDKKDHSEIQLFHFGSFDKHQYYLTPLFLSSFLNINRKNQS
jgi:hypothetical protein